MNKDNFIHLHLHNMMSNSNFFESITSTEDYIRESKKRGVDALSISNHGSVIDWVRNKRIIEQNGLKYIHAMEAYVTNDNDKTEKKTRDNFHLLLIAKNWEGVKEINKLSSDSYNRKTNNFYYNPRVYAEDIFNTSDNVIILSACLSSPLNPNKQKNEEDKIKWQNFFIENKDRVWIEVQPHNDKYQAEYNRFLLNFAEENGLNIIATNDVHHLNMEQAEIARKIKEEKGIVFDNDDKFELYFKTRQEMFDSFKKQGVLTDEQINTALDNTIVVEQQIEEFELDLNFKYPKLFNPKTQMLGDINVSDIGTFKNSTELFIALIKHYYKVHQIDTYPTEKKRRYQKRIIHELDTYIKLGSVDYMLLEYMIKRNGREGKIIKDKHIQSGYARGSVSGSLIAYLLGITYIDPLPHDLVFERFMNKDRVSLADIDSDYAPKDRYAVMYYLLKHDFLKTASIMTKNTYAKKGSVKAIGRTMGYTPTELNQISDSINDDGSVPKLLYNEHKELFDKAQMAEGSVDSIGRHAAGIVISDMDIDELFGTMTLPNWEYKVTQIDMGDISYLNFLKLDILGLDNWNMILRTAELADIPIPTPQSNFIDFNDMKVWESIAEDNTAIFQFESERGGELLSTILSNKTLENIHNQGINIDMIELMSLCNASQRPTGASYINQVIHGETLDHGHEVLNDFLSNTLGYIVYQEQLVQFMVEFANYTPGQADIIRRAIGKLDKKTIDNEVPKIREAFVDTMVDKYNDDREHAEKIADSFMRIFLDSAQYGFSLNHSIPYSYIGYISGWLRYYYPLEFVASALETWDKGDKNNLILEYARKNKIDIREPRFRMSQGGYGVDKKDNAIYQGTGHIKFCNKETGDVLYTLKDNQYNYFTDLILDINEHGYIICEEMGIDDDVVSVYNKLNEDDIKELDKLNKEGKVSYTKQSLGINKRKFDALIRLQYFSNENFGDDKKLLTIYEEVVNKYNPNNKTFLNKYKKYHELIDFEKELKNDKFSVMERLEAEMFYTGFLTTYDKTLPNNLYFVAEEVYKQGTSYVYDLYSIHNGKMATIKIGKNTYRNVPFKVGDLLQINPDGFAVKSKYIRTNNGWEKSSTEKDLWVEKLKMIKRG